MDRYEVHTYLELHGDTINRVDLANKEVYTSVASYTKMLIKLVSHMTFPDTFISYKQIDKKIWEEGNVTHFVLTLIDLQTNDKLYLVSDISLVEFGLPF